MSSFSFPNVKDKLDAPARKTAFERAKAEAEAKRAREAAETAAVYEDFVKSFEDEGPKYGGSDRGGFGGRGGGSGLGRGTPAGGPGKRHFTTTGRSAISGPGTLGPPPGRKREYDAYREGGFGRGGSRGGFGDSGRLGFDDPGDYVVSKTPAKSDRGIKFGEDEEDEEAQSLKKEQAKPTISLTHLLPKTTKTMVLEMMAPYFPSLTGGQVALTHGHASNAVRKAASALITLQTDTAASEIDAAVNGLSNRYLGAGFRLGISRHLPSTIVNTTITPGAMANNAAPFNARPLFTGGRGGFGRGGFAPPPSFGHGSAAASHVNQSKYVISVTAPKDLKSLRLIHKTVELVLTHGPDFEALLMATPAIINDERYFWLWDSKSAEHVYYRWRLWDVVTAGDKNNERSYAGTTITHLFDNSISWELPPKKQQKFEFITDMKDFIEDEEYHSSSDEDDESHQAQDSNPNAEDTKTYLGPLRRAKLYHLLSRVPTTTGTLRRGDVARVTAFAVDNAYAAEEIVDIMCANVSRPVAWSSANPDNEASALKDTSGNANVQKEDQTPARMIALYLISDVLSNSGLGVRNVWRFRQYFDQRLREGKIFEGLAEVGEKENWGKIRQEKWKRSIHSILALWESLNLFPQTSHEALRLAFEESTSKSSNVVTDVAAVEEEEAKEAPKEIMASKSKWRSVSEGEAEQPKFNPYLANVEHATEDVDGDLIDEDVDGEAMIEDDEDIDGKPMVEDDEEADGEPMAEDEEKTEDKHEDVMDDEDDMFERPAIGFAQKKEEEPPTSGPSLGVGFGFKFGGLSSSAGNGEKGRKKRVKAEDMFAADDSD